MNSIYETYRLYLSLKLHFTTQSYNYFKYNGKVNCKKVPENQHVFFLALSNKYKKEDLIPFFVSNLLSNPNVWVNEFLGEECKEIYKNHLKKMSNLSYIFKNNVCSLLEENNDLNYFLKFKKQEFPLLMKYVQRGDIELETLLILNDIVGFFSMWDKNIEETLIWKSFRFKCLKYFPFLKFDKNKFKQILKSEIINYK